MELCSVCRDISPSALLDEVPIVLSGGIETMKSGYQHVSDYEDLFRSGKTCPMCAMLRQELKEGKLRKGKKHSVILMGDVHHANPDAPYRLAGIVALVKHSDFRAYFQVYSDPGNDAALSGDVAGRPIPLDPASDESLNQLKSWLTECCDGHPECGLGANAGSTEQGQLGAHSHPYASRLLDVSNSTSSSSRCRLVNRADAPGEYIALSYCWGTGPQLRTLKNNMTLHQTHGIDLKNLPLTIRDAITVTRKLGIRYLWVDALCIVQDDVQDWMVEAAHMDCVYRDAFCTIAAAATESSGGGFLLARRPPEPVVTITYRCDPGDLHTENPCSSTGHLRNMHITPSRHTYLSDVQESVWNTRGWILQERNLSRRIGIFGRGQTFFECRRHSLGQDARDLSFHQAKRFGTLSIPQGAAWGWCLLVQDFTSRQLTFAHDRLVAIDGLARDVAARMDGAIYCAGVFFGSDSQQLLVQGLWYCDNSSNTAGSASDRAAGLRRAPSWSWGSVDVPVRWESWMMDARKDCILRLASFFADLSPVDKRLPEAVLDYEGLVVAVRRFAMPIANDTGDCDLEGNHAYVIDIRKHALCYALIDIHSEVRVGWAVFDELIAETELLLAASVSRNNEENERKATSVNVIILRSPADASEKHLRLGMGELTRIDKLHFTKCSITIG